MKRKFEIQVSELLDDGYLSCRNLGPDIPLGTILNLLQKYRYQSSDLNADPAVLFEDNDIEFKLIQVIFANKCIDYLPRGHSAVVKFEGERLGDLIALCSSLKKHEYVGLSLA